MPLQEIDYSKTHFYKIVCKELSVKDCYIGHTTNFNRRKGNIDLIVIIQKDTITLPSLRHKPWQEHHLFECAAWRS